MQREKFDAWAERYRARLALENSNDGERTARMHRANPEVRAAQPFGANRDRIRAARRLSETQRLLKVLQRPYDEQPEHEADAGFPPTWATQLEVSCSS